MVRKNEQMFEKITLSPLAQKILTFLARSPGQEFYMRELTESLPASLGGCHSALKDLRSKGLVQSRRSGRNLYHQAAGDNPSIVHFKVFMNVQEVRGVVEGLREVSLKVVLFGSCATGEDTHRSDIDLLVVTNEAREVASLLAGVHVNGRSLSPIVLSPSKLLGIKEEDRALYDEMRKGIVLWGGDHE